MHYYLNRFRELTYSLYSWHPYSECGGHLIEASHRDQDDDSNDLACLCSVLHWGTSQCEHEIKTTEPRSDIAADIIHIEMPKQSTISNQR